MASPWRKYLTDLLETFGSTHMSRLKRFFHCVKHWSKFSQPVTINRCDTLHVFLEIRNNWSMLFAVILMQNNIINTMKRNVEISSRTEHLGVILYLGSHNQFMIYNVIWGESHPKQWTCWMQMTWHPCTHVDIFTNTLKNIS